MSSYPGFSFRHCIRTLSRRPDGFGVIEFALLAPIFIMIVLAVIDFGYVYVMYEAEGRGLSAIAAQIQQSPSTTRADAQFMFAEPLSPAMFDIATPGHDALCAQSYATKQEASSGGTCEGSVGSPGTNWVTSPPAGVPAGQVYYVALVVKIKPNVPVPMYKWFSADGVLTQRAVVPVGGTTPSNCPTGYLTYSSGTFVCNSFPSCSGYLSYNSGTGWACTTPQACTNGGYLEYSAGAWICSNPPPNCTNGGFLEYNSGSWSCQYPPSCSSGQALTYTSGFGLTCSGDNSSGNSSGGPCGSATGYATCSDCGPPFAGNITTCSGNVSACNGQNICNGGTLSCPSGYTLSVTGPSSWTSYQEGRNNTAYQYSYSATCIKY